MLAFKYYGKWSFLYGQSDFSSSQGHGKIKRQSEATGPLMWIFIIGEEQNVVEGKIQIYNHVLSTIQSWTQGLTFEISVWRRLDQEHWTRDCSWFQSQPGPPPGFQFLLSYRMRPFLIIVIIMPPQSLGHHRLSSFALSNWERNVKTKYV